MTESLSFLPVPAASTIIHHSPFTIHHSIPLVCLLFVLGCGYHLAGEKSGLPDDVRSLSVGTIRNRSREHGLEKTLAFALEREIHERGRFRMEEDAGGGDAVLSGTIR